MYMYMIKTGLTYLTLSLLIMLGCTASKNRPGPEKPPPMGWNSWNWFGKKINEEIISETIDALVSTGLRDVGYNYIIIDGGWRGDSLNADGTIPENRERFPGGLKYLVDKAHENGLKVGIHTCPGLTDCGGKKVGVYGHEEAHLQQLVALEVDYIKLDCCGCHRIPGTSPEEIYTKWRKLLDNCERDIFLSGSAGFSIKPETWKERVPRVFDMCRTTADIAAYGSNGARFKGKGKNHSITEIADINNKMASVAGNGYWNDPDMLVIGHPTLTVAEQESHMALWCIMTAPLILGNDVRNMGEVERSILFNREAIAVDQDPSEQGRKIKKVGEAEVWLKNLSDGSKAVALLNRDGKEQTITLHAADIQMSGPMTIRNIFRKKDLGVFTGSYSAVIPPHGVQFLKISQ